MEALISLKNTAVNAGAQQLICYSKEICGKFFFQCYNLEYSI